MKVDILLIYVIVVIAVFYLLMVRPQRRRRQTQQALLASIKKGDEVVTRDGLCGTVRQVRDEFVVVEIADHKSVRLLKSAVSEVVKSRQIRATRG